MFCRSDRSARDVRRNLVNRPEHALIAFAGGEPSTTIRAGAGVFPEHRMCCRARWLMVDGARCSMGIRIDDDRAAPRRAAPRRTARHGRRSSASSAAPRMAWQATALRAAGLARASSWDVRQSLAGAEGGHPLSEHDHRFCSKPVAKCTPCTRAPPGFADVRFIRRNRQSPQAHRRPSRGTGRTARRAAAWCCPAGPAYVPTDGDAPMRAHSSPILD